MEKDEALKCLKNKSASKEALDFFINNDYDNDLLKLLDIDQAKTSDEIINGFVNASYLLAYKKNNLALEKFMNFLKLDYEVIDQVIESFASTDDLSRCIASVSKIDDLVMLYELVYKEDLYVGVRKALGISFVTFYIESVISYDDMKDILDKFLEFDDMTDITVLMIMTLSIDDLFNEVDGLCQEGKVDIDVDMFAEGQTVDEIRDKFKNQLGYIRSPYVELIKPDDNSNDKILDEVVSQSDKNDVDGLILNVEKLNQEFNFDEGLKAYYSSFYLAEKRCYKAFEKMMSLLYLDSDRLSLVLVYYHNVSLVGRIIATLMENDSYIDSIIDLLYQSEDLNVKSICLDVLLALYSEKRLTDASLREIINDVFEQCQEDNDFLENISIFALMVRDDDLFDSILNLIEGNKFLGGYLDIDVYNSLINTSIDECEKAIKELGYVKQAIEEIEKDKM